jgi:hypothetical protein
MSESSAKSWSEVRQHYRFLKEVLEQRKKTEIEAMCGKEFPLSNFDPFMINDYFRDKDKMLKFLDYLPQKMQEFNVKGRICEILKKTIEREETLLLK